MAKYCPEKEGYVLYLECLECRKENIIPFCEKGAHGEQYSNTITHKENNNEI